jgi:hypothetical protein
MNRTATPRYRLSQRQMFIVILNRTETTGWRVRWAIISVGCKFQDRLRVLSSVRKHVLRPQGYTGHAT